MQAQVWENTKKTQGRASMYKNGVMPTSATMEAVTVTTPRGVCHSSENDKFRSSSWNAMMNTCGDGFCSHSQSDVVSSLHESCENERPRSSSCDAMMTPGGGQVMEADRGRCYARDASLRFLIVPDEVAHAASMAY